MASLNEPWSEWVFKYKRVRGCRGQVHAYTRVAALLYHLARGARGILEVGTFEGCGTSLTLAKGLLDQRSKGARLLQTIEQNHARAAVAQRILEGLGVVKVTVGSASSVADMYPLDAVLYGKLPPLMSNGNRSTYKRWWRYENRTSWDRTRVRPVAKLCASNHIDVAVMDGGEFFGDADLIEVLRHCRQLRYVVLDDTMAFKNHRTRQKLLAATSGWRLRWEDKHERNGWAIFERNTRFVCVSCAGVLPFHYSPTCSAKCTGATTVAATLRLSSSRRSSSSTTPQPLHATNCASLWTSDLRWSVVCRSSSSS